MTGRITTKGIEKIADRILNDFTPRDLAQLGEMLRREEWIAAKLAEELSLEVFAELNSDLPATPHASA